MMILRTIFKAAAVVALLWAMPCKAQNSQGGTRIIALPGNSSPGSSTITANSTATSGCGANGVLFSGSSKVQCDTGFTYAGSGGTINAAGTSGQTGATGNQSIGDAAGYSVPGIASPAPFLGWTNYVTNASCATINTINCAVNMFEFNAVPNSPALNFYIAKGTSASPTDSGGGGSGFFGFYNYSTTYGDFELGSSIECGSKGGTLSSLAALSGKCQITVANANHYATATTGMIVQNDQVGLVNGLPLYVYVSGLTQTSSAPNATYTRLELNGANGTAMLDSNSGGATASFDFGTGPGNNGNAYANTHGVRVWRFDTAGNFQPMLAQATTMTNGFSNIVGAAGAPTGVPGNTTGFSIYYDSTNKKLCVYSGGWECTAAMTP